MTSVTGTKSAEEILAHLQARSVEDIDFRNQLIADPKSVIANEFEIELPEGFIVQVHENSLEAFHVVLPPHPKLHEDKLEHVAGGASSCSCV